MESLIPIDTFTNTHPDIFFVCKALNYRAEKDKWDSDRPLSVYVDWKIVDGKLSGKLVFDHPLRKKGNEIGEKVKKILCSLKIDKTNFSTLKGLLDKDVNFYEAMPMSKV